MRRRWRTYAVLARACVAAATREVKRKGGARASQQRSTMEALLGHAAAAGRATDHALMAHFAGTELHLRIRGFLHTWDAYSAKTDETSNKGSLVTDNAGRSKKLDGKTCGLDADDAPAEAINDAKLKNALQVFEGEDWDSRHTNENVLDAPGAADCPLTTGASSGAASGLDRADDWNAAKEGVWPGLWLIGASSTTKIDAAWLGGTSDETAPEKTINYSATTMHKHAINVVSRRLKALNEVANNNNAPVCTPGQPGGGLRPEERSSLCDAAGTAQKRRHYVQMLVRHATMQGQETLNATREAHTGQVAQADTEGNTETDAGEGRRERGKKATETRTPRNALQPHTTDKDAQPRVFRDVESGAARRNVARELITRNKLKTPGGRHKKKERGGKALVSKDRRRGKEAPREKHLGGASDALPTKNSRSQAKRSATDQRKTAMAREKQNTQHRHRDQRRKIGKQDVMQQSTQQQRTAHAANRWCNAQILKASLNVTRGVATWLANKDRDKHRTAESNYSRKLFSTAATQRHTHFAPPHLLRQTHREKKQANTVQHTTPSPQRLAKVRRTEQRAQTRVVRKKKQKRRKAWNKAGTNKTARIGNTASRRVTQRTGRERDKTRQQNTEQ
ncbi:hypothetical protein, conserved in T. vivax, (fragment), partial [Trypanosoma vivax Y486]